jgi:hypothetical protein
MNFDLISNAIAAALPSIEEGNEEQFTTGGYTSRLHKEDGEYWVMFIYDHLNHQHGGRFSTIEEVKAFMQECFDAEEDQFPNDVLGK